MIIREPNIRITEIQDTTFKAKIAKVRVQAGVMMMITMMKERRVKTWIAMMNKRTMGQMARNKKINMRMRNNQTTVPE